MRQAVLAIILATLGLGARGYEVENQRLFAAGPDSPVLRIISTGDLDLFAPLVQAFQQENPDVAVDYTVASSAAVYMAIATEGAAFDLALSSAMDLQTKLANDGLAQTYSSAATAALPDWARWADRLFAFTQEPAVVLISRAGLGDLPVPKTRQDLIALLRDNPELFTGRVGTYDLRNSGLGYLFATQDARQSDAYWRLAEVMGSLRPQLFCCTSDMINGIDSGALLVAYNVIGSYADARPSEEGSVIYMGDYTHVMLRTALIPTTADNPALGGRFIEFLLSPSGRAAIRTHTGLPPIDGATLAESPSFRPIPMGAGLLVYLDQMKRAAFLDEWIAAMVQPTSTNAQGQ